MYSNTLLHAFKQVEPKAVKSAADIDVFHAKFY